MKIWRLFYTLWQGGQETRRRKKFSFFKCIQQSNFIRKKFWVLVFSFMYLVSVDPIDRSLKKIISSNWLLKTNSWKWRCFKKEYAFRNNIFPIILYRTVKLLLTTQCTTAYANIITCAVWHIQTWYLRFFFV